MKSTKLINNTLPLFALLLALRVRRFSFVTHNSPLRFPIVAVAIMVTSFFSAADAQQHNLPSPAISPDIQPVLKAHLDEEFAQVSRLTVKYRNALMTKLNSATAAGNSELAGAFRGEISEIEKLQRKLGNSARKKDLRLRMNEKTTLPDLAQDSPDSIVAIRKTWSAEREKIRKSLVERLDQSLQSLESKLNENRQTSRAAAVFAFRRSLPTSAGLAAKNPFGWKPIPDKPFPLPMPTRPTEPCRIIAWRLDGQPVDGKEFRKVFDGVPDDLGEVVDFAMVNSATPGSAKRNLMAVTPQGKVRMLDTELANAIGLSDIENVVAVASNAYTGACLRENGTVAPLVLNTPHFEQQKISVQAAKGWKHIVKVSAGIGHLVGLTKDGEILTCGQNNAKQLDVPGVFQEKTIDIAIASTSTWFVSQEGRKSWAVQRIGYAPWQGKIDRDARWFLGLGHFFADDKGRLFEDSVDESHPIDIRRIRGGDLRRIRDITSVKGMDGDEPIGLCCARDADNQWHFWGDLGSISDVSIRENEERAKGAWKIAISPPYAVALKPVANLREDDWTGGMFTELTNASPTVPGSGSLKRTVFPLPVSTLPNRHGRLEVFRRDGKDLSSTPAGVAIEKWAKSLGNGTVTVRKGVVDEGRVTIVALRNDGTIHFINESSGAPVKFDWLDQFDGRIVQFETSVHSALILTGEGKAWFYDFFKEELTPVPATGGQKIAKIAGDSTAKYCLTTHGKILVVSTDPQMGVPVSLPPAIDLAVSWRGWAYGSDGILRGWIPKKPEIGLSEPFSSVPRLARGVGPQVAWIDESGKFFKRDLKGRAIEKELVDPKDRFEQFVFSRGLVGFKKANGSWQFDGNAETSDFTYLARRARGMIQIGATDIHFFGIRPTGG